METNDELVERGRLMLAEARALNEAEYALRAANAAASQSARHDHAARAADPAAAYAAAVTGVSISAIQAAPPIAAHRGMLNDPDHCAGLFEAARAMRNTPSRTSGQPQTQSEIDADWSAVLAEQNLGASHARPTAAPESNHGWAAAFAKVATEQTQTNHATVQPEGDHGWDEIFRGLNVKVA
jgi:hypothetical protein